jgi:two-component system C4-dicarboxylate transport response regulator DctD
MTDGGRRLKLTIVEDDAALLCALVFELEAEGFEVSAFRTPAEALDRTAEADCVVAEHKLRGMDGLTLIARLRESGGARAAVLITAKPDDRCRRRAADAGVAVVEKPLIDDALNRRIREALDGVRD